ncbi:MAG: transglycosylase SLT domain-containing protein [Pseudomonadota bacterium]|nr:transglycosylase SLT domain-containing protein [Pseudomonadota bacterium]
MTTHAQAPLAAQPRRLFGLACLASLFLAACATAPSPAPVTIAASAAASAVVADAGAAMAAGSNPAGPAPAASAVASADERVPAPVPVDPIRPDVRIDIDDRSARVDLWDRLRQGFAMPNIDNDLVRDRERWYASRPDYVARMTERGGRYLFYIVEELDKRGMPTELALLPFIESAYNPQAMSTARASGMWQFIPSTGRDFELKQNVFRDDRRDVLASTRAALDYLQKLHTMFSDWQLALAAYNWGEGSVQRAMAKNQKAGLPTDYGSLRMPAETQMYLPKLQAVKNIVARPADFHLSLPAMYNHPYFLAVPIEHDMDVKVAVKLADISLEEFLTLNPQMNRPVILAAGTPQVLLPYDNANRFVRELPRHRGPLSSWTAWTAPKTMRSADAARAVGMDEDELREVNRIPARMLIKAGSTLMVPRGATLLTDVSSHLADNATMALAPDAPPLRKLNLRAGRNDSVASIATRYRISATQVADWNQVSANTRFAPGHAIVVYVPQTGRRGRATTARAARAAPIHAAAPRRYGPHQTTTAAPSRSPTHITGRSTKHLRIVRN